MANTSTNAGRHFSGAKTGGVPMPKKGSKAGTAQNHFERGGLKPQNSPVANVKTNTSKPSTEAERLINRPPMPFQTKQGPAMLPVTTTRDPGVGDGKSKNLNGLKTGPKPTISASGDRTPGGYSKVVGGQKGTSSPKHKSDPNAYAKLPAKRNASFFGGR